MVKETELNKLERLLEKQGVAQEEEIKTKTRAKRKRVYERPMEQDIPDHVRNKFLKDEYALKFIRWSIHGEEDYKYLASRVNEGYEFVSADEIPSDYLMSLRVMDTRSRKGMVTSGDCVLMKIDVELQRSRAEYYENLTNEQNNAVDINVVARKKGLKNLGSKSKVTLREPTFQD